MKKFFLGIFLLCSFGVSAETIKGSVVNERGEAMPFVTISVLAQDSSLLTGAITDDEGKYEISAPSLQGRDGVGLIIHLYIQWEEHLNIVRPPR